MSHHQRLFNLEENCSKLAFVFSNKAAGMIIQSNVCNFSNLIYFGLISWGKLLSVFKHTLNGEPTKGLTFIDHREGCRQLLRARVKLMTFSQTNVRTTILEFCNWMSFSK